jgi:hypothetical protein
MKHLFPFALLLASQPSFAQNCWHVVYPGVVPQMADGWRNSKIHPSGGLAYADWSSGITVGLTSPDGQPAWDKRVIHMSPNVSLYPYSVQPRMDGGYLVNGTFSPSWQYEASCAISMDASGGYEWARIYMADSGYQSLGGWLENIQERDDGTLIAYLNCGEAPGLAQLDATGAPLWHNRYDVSASGFAQSCDMIVEPGNAVAMVEHWYNTDETSIIHVAADGSADWSYTYTLDAFMPVDLLRAADGTYFIAGYSSLDYTGQLMHLNTDGTFDWKKDYTMTDFSAIGQMPSGDLLISGNAADVSLMQVTAAGVPVSAWSSTITDTYLHLIGLRGDSVYVSHTEGDGESDSWTGITIATSVADLSCAFTTATLPVESVSAGPVGTSSTLTVIPDQLKSWTMNIGGGAAFDEVDVRALINAGPARPGATYMVYLQGQNVGGDTTGLLTHVLTFDPLLTYMDAWPVPTSVVGNTVTWVGPENLLGFDSDFSYVMLSVPADAGLIGTSITSTLSVTQDSVETDLTNNTSAFTQVITGSFDPNDKQVLPRDFYHIENDSILDYTIQFQNTGTDTAFTVVVRDTLPLDVDTRTFEMGAASHPYTYSITGNGILVFTFNNILLPDSNTNEPLSHGLVNFRIKPILPLALGQEITNAADIYFDFNDPVRTPDATVVVTDETGVRPVGVPEKLSVFPVPVKNVLTALLPSDFTPANAVAIGMDGRRVPLFKPNMMQRRAEYNVQHLAPGAYVLTLIDKSGKRMSARFTKE